MRARLGGPVARSVRGGVRRRRVQTVVTAAVVLVSTAASTLGLGLIAASAGPFQHAFAAQHGAQLAATIDPAGVTSARLAATSRLPQVSATAGPYPEVTVTARTDLHGGVNLPPVTLVGRRGPGGPLDDLILDAGRWPTRPGEVVLSRDFGPVAQLLGRQITVRGAPGRPVLTVVGIAKSITDSAGGWVIPSAVAALRTPASAPAVQMLYSFSHARTAAQLRVSAAALTAALPAGAVTAGQSYLAVKDQETRDISIIVPFVVVFAIIGLVMSVLIVTSIVNGAVVSGYRRIGVLKSLGFTPAQVVAAYVAQAGTPALAGCLLGVLGGNLLSVPLLRQTATVYGVGRLLVPAWVDVMVPSAMLAMVGVAALLPALRAGRLSAVAAMASGRAPRPGHGYLAHRLLGRLRLPRPVTIGLAAPFARPARTAVTLTAAAFGATAVIFAVGLDSSLARAAMGESRAAAEQIQVMLPSAGPREKGLSSHSGQRPPSAARAEQDVLRALRGRPGTWRYVAETSPLIGVPGLSRPVTATAFHGAAAWTGYDIIGGRWFRGPGEIDVNTEFLTATGTSVGGTVTVTVNGRPIRMRIAGEVFDPLDQAALLTNWRSLGGTRAGLATVQYDIGLRPGVSVGAYAAALSRDLGPAVAVVDNSNDPFYRTLDALIGTLTLLLALVAALGVLSTVLLSTRDRVHDLGVLKAVGMTPRQTVTMVVCWVAGAGLAAGALAVPAGTAMHARVVLDMAHAAGTDLPYRYVAVFGPWELAALAASGLVIAVAGALAPAIWAARAAAISSMRTE